MSETVNTTTSTNEPANTGEKKKYANKFDNVEELENGYKHAARVFQDNQELSKKLEEATAVPDEYILPTDIVLPDEEAKPLKEISKKAGLTQKQVEAIAKERALAIAAHKKVQEENQLAIRKQFGQDKIALVQEFVNKNYPASVANIVMGKALSDPDAFNSIVRQWEASTNSGIPGLNTVSAIPKPPSHDDILEAHNKVQARPNDLKAREHYLNLIKQRAA